MTVLQEQSHTSLSQGFWQNIFSLANSSLIQILGKFNQIHNEFFSIILLGFLYEFLVL